MRRLALTLIVVLCFGAGCARDGSSDADSADDLPPPSSPGAVSPSRSPGLPVRPSGPGVPTGAVPSPTGFGELVAVSCGGRPSGDQVIALLRRGSVIGGSVRPTVTTGPMCAGTWQYTVLSVTSHEPLRAVSQGRPEALQLVTAGTNPCTAKVRAEAPPGILALVECT